jgi:hypothetical protein
MSAFQQEELFLHFGDTVFFALGALSAGEHSTVLCSLDDIVCAYSAELQASSTDCMSVMHLCD